MINQELTEFIKKSRIAGQTNEQIRESLNQAGWSAADIEEAIGSTEQLEQNQTDISYDNKKLVEAASVTKEEKFFKKKKFLFILILVILIGSGIWVYILTQNNPLLKENNVMNTTSSEEPEKEIIDYNLKTTKLATIPENYGWTQLNNSIKFSPDGKGVSYVAKEDPKSSEMFLMLNNEKIGAYKKSFNPVFSSNGKRFAYLAEKETGEIVVVVDGKESGNFTRIGYFTFSPNGERHAFLAWKNDKAFAVIDGKEGKHYDVLRIPPIFSPNSKRIAFVAEKDGKSFLVVDEKETELDYPAPNVMYLLFSLNSEHIVYVINTAKGFEKGKDIIMFDGEKYKSYDSIGEPIFSPDSKHFAFVAEKERKYSIVVDGKEGKFYDVVTAPIFSPDSQNLAYIAQPDKNNEKEFVVLNDNEGKLYDGIIRRQGDLLGKAQNFRAITFSFDSSQIAYAAEEAKKQFVVVNGKESNFSINAAVYGAIDPVIFSPDGKNTAYAVNSDSGKEIFVIVNNKKGKIYQTTGNWFYAINAGVWNLNFTSDNKSVYYGIKSGNELWWVVDDMK
ncbi:hypothetical protein KJ853_00570 [Patescibacteria group bacterium]|nr:hypothetical protein [Patescibacteria group bacterium]